MISVDKYVNDLVAVLLDISLNKTDNIESEINEIKKYIDEEKQRIKNFIMDIYQKTYYPEYDQFGTINDVLDIIITRNAINRFIIKLFQNRHKFYNSKIVSNIFRVVAKCMGFELDRNISTSPLLMYFLENLEYWHTVKTTEEHIYSFLKLSYPFSDIKIAKVTMYKHTISNENEVMFAVLKYGNKSTYLKYDFIKNDINHFTEYSDLLENEVPIKVDEYGNVVENYVSYTVPIISIVIEDDIASTEKTLRKYISYILKNSVIYSSNILNISGLKLNLVEAVCLYLLVNNILFSDIKKNYVQEKWFGTTFDVYDHKTLSKMLVDYYSNYASLLFTTNTSVFEKISEFLVKKIISNEIDENTNDDDLVIIILDFLRNNIVEVPTEITSLILKLKEDDIISQGIKYIINQMYLKTSLDIIDENLISLVSKLITKYVCDIVYSLKVLFDSQILTKEDVYKFLVEISTNLDSIFVDSSFTQYVTNQYARNHDISEIESMLYIIKPMYLHFSNFSFVTGGDTTDSFKLNETVISYDRQIIHEDLIRETDYCNTIKNLIENNSLTHSSVDLLQVNLLDYYNSSFRLDQPNNIVFDSILPVFVYYQTLDKYFLSTSSKFIRDFFTIKNENMIEVVTW